jgi:hypothetical protein
MEDGKKCLGTELMMAKALKRRVRKGTRYQNVKLKVKNKKL